MSESTKPNADGFISVSGKADSQSNGHQLYWQEYGNPQGFPVMLLHGGPGSGAMVRQEELFDHDRHRIIMFDQRGAGKSTPHASLEENTTNHLIEDINLIRQNLGIKGKMHLFGGSWGSSLSLVYAIKHPLNVASLTLYGIFLGRKNDLADFYQSNANNLDDLKNAGLAQRKLDKEWRRYVEFIPKEHRNDMMNAYHEYLICDDADVKLKAAQHWNRWERAALKYDYNEDYAAKEPSDSYSLAHARLENHYFRHGLFLGTDKSREQNYILNNVEKIADISLSIIQGESDFVCPKNQAEDLFAAANKVSKINPPKLHIVKKAGHSMLDPENYNAIIKQTKNLI